jgi:hypothetical protein
MHRLVAALAALSLPAFAQADIDLDHDVEETTVQVPGVQVKVRTRGPGVMDPAPFDGPAPAAPQQVQPPPRTLGVEHFSIDYAPTGVPASTIQVLSPEGASAEVWSDAGQLEGRFSVPFNFRGRANTWYRFILVGPDGLALFDRKLEVKRFLGGTLRMRRAAPVVVAPPPPPVMVAAGMPAHDFDALVAAVNDASFGDEKLGVISTAAQSHVFTVDQVGALVDLLSHSSEKVKVVELTRHRLVDRHNSFRLLSHFTFSSDKQKVQQLLK